MNRFTGRNESICSYCEYNKDNRCRKKDPDYCMFLQTWNKLKECENKQEDGYMLDLPCKPGDTVYQINNDEIETYQITDVIITHHGIGFENPYQGQGFNIEEFGKTVFLDEDRANEELEKLRG